MQQIGFGGSCHWCTEAIFRSLRGVQKVDQGWIASDGGHTQPSEAVIVHFDENEIDLRTLIAIHLYTHSCTSTHSMRGKYRSAVYTFDKEQNKFAKAAIRKLQADFGELIITEVLPFVTFKLNDENYLDYYYKDPSKPFCQNIVNPKLSALLARFEKYIAPEYREQLARL
ncbi:peptide-methionine (S)-S-oxide reductase [Mucilaginibacter sabulilitoris]|uniref:peptide-methionine (S)-S-oxide reductase n=1 Tax=Mucilaginibacter sabulilitoris TaxID=1173583 RepID=A0ABZ0TVA1_9SPHI|nr:peptide-methionine (S)-S-oxide reductase [Mucilaginibacter sabulilitoris]WPU97036.1 peptide-methionine (S)-S-oxide reductase [Mucilaginibacter sabulilitoris]